MKMAKTVTFEPHRSGASLIAQRISIWEDRSVRPDIVLYMRALYNGGTEQVMVNLAGEFQRRGLAVTFLVDFHNPYSPFNERLPKGVNFVALEAQGMIARYRKLKQYLTQHAPPAMISAGYFPNIYAILATQAAKVGTKLVVTEHNSPKINRELSAPWEARRWFLLFARHLYPRAHAVVAVSNGTAQDLATETGMAREEIATIYNPIVDDHLLAAAKQPLDDPWFVGSDVPVVVAVGRLEPQKNYSALLRAIALVNKERPCRLIILGDGSEHELLKNLAVKLNLADKVKLPGFVANPHAYTSRASMLTLSSIWEGLSCVLIEGLAVGAPIVSTDCPFGPREVLGDGKYGTLVPVNDDQALARAMLRVMNERPRPAPRDWLDQFTIGRSADQYLQLISLQDRRSSARVKTTVIPTGELAI